MGSYFESKWSKRISWIHLFVKFFAKQTNSSMQLTSWDRSRCIVALCKWVQHHPAVPRARGFMLFKTHIWPKKVWHRFCSFRELAISRAFWARRGRNDANDVDSWCPCILQSAQVIRVPGLPWQKVRWVNQITFSQKKQRNFEKHIFVFDPKSSTSLLTIPVNEEGNSLRPLIEEAQSRAGLKSTAAHAVQRSLGFFKRHVSELELSEKFRLGSLWKTEARGICRRRWVA